MGPYFHCTTKSTFSHSASLSESWQLGTLFAIQPIMNIQFNCPASQLPSNACRQPQRLSLPYLPLPLGTLSQRLQLLR